MPDLIAYVDGGSLGNPGPSGIGVIIDGCENVPIRIQKWIGHQDNNVAEYLALLEALQHALAMSARALHVFSDSEIVVKQMRGEYACRSPRLYSLNWICRKLARSLEFSISHVRREQNREANSLAPSLMLLFVHSRGLAFALLATHWGPETKPLNMLASPAKETTPNMNRTASDVQTSKSFLMANISLTERIGRD